MVCKSCGKEIQDGSKFCPLCGAVIEPKEEVPIDMDRITGIEWFQIVMKKAFDFKTRASREEFWVFTAFNAIFSVSILLFSLLSHHNSYYTGYARLFSDDIIYSLYSIIVFIPQLSVGVRRMHDQNMTGWLYIVPIANIVFACLEGDKKANRFGDIPSKRWK